MKSHYRGHKMAIWLNLIPQLHQPGDEDVSMRHHHFHERDERYYQGIVQPESLTRPSPRYLPASPQTQLTTFADCIPNMTELTVMNENEVDKSESEEEIGILQRLADGGYHSYATALGVTVGVGCLLLILNLLIFAGIYYQREKNRKRRKRSRQCSPESQPETISELTQRSPDTTRGAHVIKLQEPPPCYNVVTKSSHLPNSLPGGKYKEPPTPPARTSSNTTSTVKKRVQIQEISV